MDELRTHHRLKDMKNFLYGTLFDYDAAGRLRIFPTGWLTIASVLGLAVLLGVSLMRWALMPTDIAPLGTPLPRTTTPSISWTVMPTVHPNGTTVYTAPREVRDRAADGFVKAWEFLNARVDPKDERLVAQQMAYFVPASQAEKWAKSVIDGTKLSGSYWRQKIEGPFSLSNDTYASADGRDISFTIGVPEKFMRRELIDLSSGAVMLSQPKALVVTVKMRYNFDKHWQMLEIRLP